MATHIAGAVCVKGERRKQDTIRLLIDASPGTVMEADSRGNTALHQSLKYPACSLAIVQMLLAAAPAAASAANGCGFTPLHFAASHLGGKLGVCWVACLAVAGAALLRRQERCPGVQRDVAVLQRRNAMNSSAAFPVI
jgi:hypothetical protein